MQLTSVRGNRKSILLVLALKLAIVPALVTVCATALGFRGLQWFILFIYFGAPTAVSSVSMAENMGGDGELAGELVVATTLASIFSIFFWIVAASSLGIM
jgi:predicted permease